MNIEDLIDALNKKAQQGKQRVVVAVPGAHIGDRQPVWSVKGVKEDKINARVVIELDEEIVAVKSTTGKKA